jgi:hypothetical protein
MGMQLMLYRQDFQSYTYSLSLFVTAKRLCYLCRCCVSQPEKMNLNVPATAMVSSSNNLTSVVFRMQFALPATTANPRRQLLFPAKADEECTVIQDTPIFHMGTDATFQDPTTMAWKQVEYSTVTFLVTSIYSLDTNCNEGYMYLQLSIQSLADRPHPKGS